MNLKFLFTKKQFLSHYMNIGAISASVNRNNSYYLLGLYYNSTIVNLNLVIYKIRKRLKLMFCACTKNFLNVLIVNTIENKFLYRFYKKFYKANFLSYFLGNWWNGFLRNFKKYIKYITKRSSQYKIIKNRLPVFLIYISHKRFFRLDFSSSTFSKEINSTSVLSALFVDTTSNSYTAPDVIFQNIRGSINNLFLSKISVSCVKKVNFIKRKKFVSFILKRCKIFQLNIKARKLFFEIYFIYKNNKNFFKTLKWKL